MTQNDRLQEASFATKRSLPATKRSLQRHADRHPPAREMDTPKADKLRHEEDVAAAPRVGTRQARGMDTPKANKLRHEEVVAAAPRVGTRQVRGMDTPKANKLRHEEVVAAAPRVGTRQVRGMDTPKANKLCHEEVVASPGDGCPEKKQRCSSTTSRHPPSPGDRYPRKPTSFTTKRSLQQHRG